MPQRHYYATISLIDTPWLRYATLLIEILLHIAGRLTADDTLSPLLLLRHCRHFFTLRHCHAIHYAT